MTMTILNMPFVRDGWSYRCTSDKKGIKDYKRYYKRPLLPCKKFKSKLHFTFTMLSRLASRTMARHIQCVSYYFLQKDMTNFGVYHCYVILFSRAHFCTHS